MSDKLIIGITGGVGAGKSTVLGVLREKFGARIFLADEVAHGMMEPGSEGLSRIVEKLGMGFLAEDGSIDRKAFADLIFHDSGVLETINSIIHPMVWHYMKHEAMTAPERLIIIEAAVFDTAPEGLFDEIWYVYASAETRIARLMESRGYSRDRCESIIRQQDSEDVYRSRSIRQIDNEGSLADVERQLKEILAV